MSHLNRIAYYRSRCEPPLTQADLARLIEVHPNSVQNWERAGVARHDVLLRLCGVFVEHGALVSYQEALEFWQCTARNQGAPPPELRLLFARGGAVHERQPLAFPLDEPPPPPSSAAGVLHYQPNRHFVGRDADLRVLAALLRLERSIVAIMGIGGLGKTQLALEFAHRYGALVPGGVCWIDAADPSSISSQVAAWGGQTGGPQAAGLSFARRLALAQELWREPTPRLLIFDNCESPPALFEWLPPCGGCRVVVTSRTRAWRAYPHVAGLDLRPLDRRDSVALLRSLGALQADAEQDLDAIAATLGDLPLALHLAGKHLAHAGVGAATYAAQLRRQLPLRHPSLQKVGPSPTSYARRLTEMIDHVYRRLDDREEDVWGRKILAVARHLAPGAPIPAALLQPALGAPAEAAAPVAAALLRLGDDLGIVELGRDSRELRVHPVVHAYLRELPAEPAVYAAVVQAALDTLATSVTGGTVLADAVMLHLRHIADEALARGAAEAGELCRALAWPLATAAQYPAARHYAERAVALCEAVHGPDHPAVAGAVNVLALIEQITGDFAVAEEALLRALTIWERTCGPASSEVATACNNLGFLNLLRGRFEASEGHLRRALRLRHSVDGLYNAGTARIIHNLGYLALKRRHTRAADRYLGLALAIRRRVLPEPSLATAFTLALLADVRLLLGDLPAAEGFAREALEIRRLAGGSQHDDVSSSLAQLGRIRQAAGDLPAAASLVEQALQMRERLLGPNAPETLSDVTLLGVVYGAQGRCAEARTLLDRAVAGLAQAPGKDSPAYAEALAERLKLGE